MSDTLETTTEATRSRGCQYFGVCDHSKSAHYAGGLSVEEIAKQQTEADALNRGYGSAFRIFKGIKSDILPDGSLDYPDDVLARFDFIVASVHGQFMMDRTAQTSASSARSQILHYDPGAYDRAATAAPFRVRHRH